MHQSKQRLKLQLYCNRPICSNKDFFSEGITSEWSGNEEKKIIVSIKNTFANILNLVPEVRMEVFDVI